MFTERLSDYGFQAKTSPARYRPTFVPPGEAADNGDTHVVVANGEQRARRDLLVDRRVAALRKRLSEVLVKLRDLARDLGQEQEVQVARDAVALVNSPFLFVVVGEIKSGKSSFVNALLHEDVCKVDPLPCTDSVQEIVYAESEKQEVLGPSLMRLGRPIEILRSIAVVDTPGTNSVIHRHETITRDYIPHSDLVIFVFAARNPHTESSWALLDYVNQEWRRKVIFVLQQADLERDHLPAQIESVRGYALKHDLGTPTIFPTSAKQELAGDREESGFDAVREYIRHQVTGGRQMVSRLAGQLDTTRQLLTRVRQRLDEDRHAVEADRKRREWIGSRLASGEARSLREIDTLLERLLAAHDAITQEFRQEFRSGLGSLAILRRAFRWVTGSESHEEWVEDLHRRFHDKLCERMIHITTTQADRLVEGIRQLLIELLERLNGTASISMGFDAATRTTDTAKEILDGVKRQLSEWTNGAQALLDSLTESSEGISRSLLGGGFMMAAGGVTAAALEGEPARIAGAGLAGLGFLVASVALLWRRRRLVARFLQGVREGKDAFQSELRQKLASDMKSIYQGVDRLFARFYDDLEAREKELKPRLGEIQQAESALSEIESQVREMEPAVAETPTGPATTPVARVATQPGEDWSV